jgi:hypothetical protein
VLVVVVVACLVGVAAATAAKGKQLVAADLVEAGEVTRGGDPAHVFVFSFQREEVEKSTKGFISYPVWAEIHAAPGDDGTGLAVLYRAPGRGRWRDAIADLAGISTAFADFVLPVSKDTDPFPPLRIRYRYQMTVDGKSKEVSLNTDRVGSLIKRPLGLLTPGTHAVALRTCVSLAPHPLKTLDKFLGYLIAAKGLAGIRSLKGLVKWAVKAWLVREGREKVTEAILGRACSTWKYKLHVPATVPLLLGKSLAVAKEFLKRRHLVAEPVPTKCTAAQAKRVGGFNHVRGQTPNHDKLVDPGTKVRIGYCVSQTPAGQGGGAGAPPAEGATPTEDTCHDSFQMETLRSIAPYDRTGVFNATLSPTIKTTGAFEVTCTYLRDGDSSREAFFIRIRFVPPDTPGALPSGACGNSKPDAPPTTYYSHKRYLQVSGGERGAYTRAIGGNEKILKETLALAEAQGIGRACPK